MTISTYIFSSLNEKIKYKNLFCGNQIVFLKESEPCFLNFWNIAHVFFDFKKQSFTIEA